MLWLSPLWQNEHILACLCNSSDNLLFLRELRKKLFPQKFSNRNFDFCSLIFTSLNTFATDSNFSRKELDFPPQPESLSIISDYFYFQSDKFQFHLKFFYSIRMLLPFTLNMIFFVLFLVKEVQSKLTIIHISTEKHCNSESSWFFYSCLWFQ